MMAGAYTLKRLTDVEDSAPKFGMEELQEVRMAGGDLDAERTGLSHHRLKPSKRQAFAHSHDEAEEIYVVVAGSGRVPRLVERRRISCKACPSRSSP